MDALNNFWSVYSNLVLTLGTNALLALSNAGLLPRIPSKGSVSGSRSARSSE